jgi:hypothetical protein
VTERLQFCEAFMKNSLRITAEVRGTGCEKPRTYPRLQVKKDRAIATDGFIDAATSPQFICRQLHDLNISAS